MGGYYLCVDPLTEFDSLHARDAFLGRLARSLIGDVHQAEDVAQSTWLAALEQAESEALPPKAWLAGTLRRVWGKTLRGETRRTARERKYSKPDVTDPLLKVLKREEARRLLLEALESLEAPYRNCLLLRYFEGLPPRTIALRLALPVETVKTRLQRGKQRLRAQLDRQIGGDRTALALAPLAKLASTSHPSSQAWPTIFGLSFMSLQNKILLAVGLLFVLGLWMSWETPEAAPPEPEHGLQTQGPPLQDPEELEPQREKAELEDLGTRTSTPALPKTSGHLWVKVRHESGTPGSAVPIVVQRWNRQGLGKQTQLANSDRDGIARFSDLAPGTVRIWSPIGGQNQAEISAGKVTQMELVLQDTLAIRGKVLDPEGHPVVKAKIWSVSIRTDWLGTLQVAESNQNGEFTLPFIARFRALGATAEGWGPSELFDLRTVETESSSAEVNLVLNSEGGGLRGKILSHKNQPIAGARIAVGDPPEVGAVNSLREWPLVWSTFTAVSDSEGNFAVRGLKAGKQTVHVRAEGFEPLTSWCDIPVGGIQNSDFILTPGVSVIGTVRDRVGNPVSDALVLLLDEPFTDPYLTQGPTDPGAPFRRPATVSDATGKYRLTDLPAGSLHLYSAKGISGFTGSVDIFQQGGSANPYEGSDQASLQGSAGQQLEWNPVLNRGSRVYGRILFADGTPMGLITVRAKEETGDQYFIEIANRDGYYEIPGLTADQRYEIRVLYPALPSGARPMEELGVMPSETPLDFVADFSPTLRREPGLVKARIVDQANRILESAQLKFHSEEMIIPAEKEMDLWVASLPPGRYYTRIVEADKTLGFGDWFEISSGQEIDLGNISTSPSCSLVVDIHRPPSLEGKQVWLSLDTGFPPRHPALPLAANQQTMQFDDLSEGRVWLTAAGPGIAYQKTAIQLNSGQNKIALHLEPAAVCPVKIDCQESLRRGFGDLTLITRRSDGSLYLETRWNERWGGKLPVEFQLSVPPGGLLWEAHTTSGLRASGKLESDGSTQNLEPVTWILR
ncbi:MAG: hypothetical protein DWQ01_02250 [Planctomycetota bacterium]|nr:MAG: hypothetical protein DWQ01_02250 [Planctomycetota bacterium]